MAERDDASASGLVMSFLLGGLAGAAIAILFAPRPGRETREILTDRLQEGLARGKDLGDDLVRRGKAAANEAVTYIEERRDRMSAAVEAGTQAYRDPRKA